MSKSKYISRYTLIIKRLQQSPATLEEIKSFLLRNGDHQISKRTFQRDVEDIASEFGYEITYNNSLRVYEIDDEGDDVKNKMLEAFDTFHALNITNKLSTQIYFESRKPKGTEHLHGLLHAIQNKLCLRFVYQKFQDNEISNRTIEPYALKEFRARWYVLAIDKKDNKLKTFGLDRIRDLEISKQKFKPDKTINPDKLFTNYFGLINAKDTSLEKIILSFTPTEGRYIQAYPLHHSQETLIDNDNEVRVQLLVHITEDLIAELLSHGEELKIISPAKLKNRMIGIYKNALKQYE